MKVMVVCISVSLAGNLQRLLEKIEGVKTIICGGNRFGWRRDPLEALLEEEPQVVLYEYNVADARDAKTIDESLALTTWRQLVVAGQDTRVYRLGWYPAREIGSIANDKEVRLRDKGDPSPADYSRLPVSLGDLRSLLQSRSLKGEKTYVRKSWITRSRQGVREAAEGCQRHRSEH